ncbi:MAG: hypothetical protein ACLQBK_14095 [Candidatus Sulfotelmatobacter sp.]
MAQAVDGIASTLEQLCERIQELERRVSTLEDPTAGSGFPRLTGTEIQEPRVRAPRRALSLVDASGGAVPILGKAVLGIAGAYLLRAIAETGSIPKLPVLLVAIVYAALWMVWAARMHATSRFASVTYGITSALILSPLLWESTVRFQVLSPAFAAVVLAAFLVLSFALAWRHNLQGIPWIAMLASVGTALALIIGTRELVPLTAALLAVALTAEVATCLGHRLTLRAVPALAADFAVWLLVFVLTSSGGVPEGYRPVSAAVITTLCLALAAIYGGSIGVRSFGLRQRITLFEIGQGVLAFVLAAYGVMRATQGSAAAALGGLFLLLAAGCYWGALSRFTDQVYTRNRRVSANWAAALLLAGSFLLFPANFQVPILCWLAAAAAFVYTRTRKLSLGLHASFYLVAAAAVSALPAYAASALIGNVPGAPDWTVWTVVISSVVCYAVGSRAGEDQGKRRLLWVVPAALVGFAGAALAVAAIVGLFAGRMELGASRLSVVRTIVNCALALALGFLGSRWKRVELGWVAYAAVAFGTLKLLFEDLRFGNAASLVVSLLFYGLILILLPRWTRRGKTES